MACSPAAPTCCGAPSCRRGSGRGPTTSSNTKLVRVTKATRCCSCTYGELLRRAAGRRRTGSSCARRRGGAAAAGALPRRGLRGGSIGSCARASSRRRPARRRRPTPSQSSTPRCAATGGTASSSAAPSYSWCPSLPQTSAATAQQSGGCGCSSTTLRASIRPGGQKTLGAFRGHAVTLSHSGVTHVPGHDCHACIPAGPMALSVLQGSASLASLCDTASDTSMSKGRPSAIFAP